MTDAALRWFSDVGLSDRPAVGGKGASLGELTAAGIRVPPGFVITTGAFANCLAALDRDGSLRRGIESLDPADLAAIGTATGTLRASIQGGVMPSALQAVLVTAYRELCEGVADAPVAVRSSAISEDSAQASFAGLQDTLLWVRGVDAVVAAVLQCWASLYSVESVSYRLRLKLPEDQIAMAVVIQRMVDARSAGVMFTRSPTTGDRSVIAIEGSWGLGSALVSGEVTPDSFVVNKVTGDIVKRTVSIKTVQHVPEAAGGIANVAIDTWRQSTPCLSDDEIVALANTAKRIERHYGSAQDIEWAIGRDGLEYLLQSRPETVWSARDAAPVVAPRANTLDHVFAAFSGRKP